MNKTLLIRILSNDTSFAYSACHEKGGRAQEDDKSCARTMLQSQSAEMALVCTKKYAAKALHQNRAVVRRGRQRSFAATQSHCQMSYGLSNVCR